MKQITKTIFTWTIPSRKHLVAYVLLAAILIGGTTWVFAQGGDDGLIHACVADPGSQSQSQNMQGQANAGSVRIVDNSATDCKPGETPLTWPGENDGDILANLFCASGEVAKWDGNAWVCASDVDTDTVLDQAGIEALGFVTGPHTTELDWTAILNRPDGLDDGDDDTQLTEVQVEGFVTNGPLDLAAGTTVGGLPFPTRPQNIVVVAQSGGDFTNVQAALDSITDAATDNRYLIKIAPGTYAGHIMMKPYVDIEGSGEGVTILTCACGGTVFDSGSATVVGAENSELRLLAVENTGNSTYAIGIYIGSTGPDPDTRLTNVTVTTSGPSAGNYGVRTDSSSPRMSDVTVVVSGASDGNYGFRNSSSSSVSLPIMTNISVSVQGGSNSFGVHNDTSSPTMTNITIEVSDAVSGSNNIGYGVYNINSSSPSMTNVTVTASGSAAGNIGVVALNSSSPTIEHSVIRAIGTGAVGLSNWSATSSTVRVANTQIVGGAVDGSGGIGSITCFNTYDGSFAAYTCP